jgi:hypothetical protein
MKYYQLKIQLNRIKPSVYRKILVKPNLKLSVLHDIIQIVMPWGGHHLHQFEIFGQNYSDDVDNSPLDSMDDIISSNKIKLNQIFNTLKQKIYYEYDFGDYWLHTITFEKEVELKEKFKAKLIGGKNACPPDDCGGPYGYYELLEIINNPEHEDYEDRLEWLGPDFDSTYFNIDVMNAALTHYINSK